MYNVCVENMPDMHVNTYVHACVCAMSELGSLFCIEKKKKDTASKNPTCLFTT